MTTRKGGIDTVSRRHFLGALGIGATGLGGGTLGCAGEAGDAQGEADIAMAVDGLSAPRAGDEFGRAMRRMFVLDPKVLYMNIGTVGSPPREVLEVNEEIQHDVARNAKSTYGAYFDDARQRAASDFGCDPDEIVISNNTSDAVSKILAGLDLRPGDEILTTNHEHSAAESPMSILRDRRGVVLRRVLLPLGNEQRAEDYVARFRDAITTRTKVMLFSAPTYKTGTMLPIRMLSELAQEYGLVTVVDGAHLPGMMAVELHSWGIDFFAGAGSKWQCGPAGTGLMYIRNKVLAEYNPLPLPVFWPTISSAYPAGGLPPRTATRTAAYDIGQYMQAIGNGSLAAVGAFQRACEVWNRVGRARIQDYVLGLSQYLKEHIVSRWGVAALFSPKDDSRLVSALTSFNPFSPADLGNTAKFDAFVSSMKERYDIVVRSTAFPFDATGVQHHGIRVSTHLFHTRAEIDRAVAAMWDLSRQMR